MKWLILSASITFALAAWLVPIDANAHILCHRDAEITPVKASFGQVDGDPCSGTVALQGISYECGKSADYSKRISQFISDLGRNGREYCESYCKKRSRDGVKCKAFFTPPSQCGFTVPKIETERFGKTEAKCNPNCEGTALLYCSIYHGPFLGTDPKFIADARPNCRCEKASD